MYLSYYRSTYVFCRVYGGPCITPPPGTPSREGLTPSDLPCDVVHILPVVDLASDHAYTSRELISRYSTEYT